MPVDPMLLEILVCPDDRSELELVALPEAVRGPEGLADRAELGLACASCDRVYPIVSDIPVMLLEEALSRADLEP